MTYLGRSYGNTSTEVLIGFEMSYYAYYCNALARSKNGTIPFCGLGSGLWLLYGFTLVNSKN